jgi:hypothetical protein
MKELGAPQVVTQKTAKASFRFYGVLLKQKPISIIAVRDHLLPWSKFSLFRRELAAANVSLHHSFNTAFPASSPSEWLSCGVTHVQYNYSFHIISLRKQSGNTYIHICTSRTRAVQGQVQGQE